MTKDDLIQKLQGSFGRSNPVDVEDIEEWITLEGLTNNETRHLYNIVKRHHVVNYFPKYGQIINYWEKYGSKETTQEGYVTREYVMEKCKSYTIQEIRKTIDEYRSIRFRNTFQNWFIAIYDDVNHAYGIKMDKYSNAKWAEEAAIEVKDRIYAGFSDYSFDYSEVTPEFVGNFDKRQNKVVKSKDVIAGLF